MPCFPSRRVTAAALAAGLAAGVHALLQGQVSQLPAADAIQSLVEPGARLVVRARSPLTGLVTFASGTGQGLLLPGMAAAPADERALAFVDQYGESFGLANRADVQLLKAPQRDALGLEHVRLRQVAEGIPVTAGELLVHLRGERVVAVNGRVLPGPFPPRFPDLTPAAAQEAARVLIEKHMPDLAAGAQYSEPRLELFNRGMLDAGTHPTRLAWFVEATGEALREYIWVDAASGGILLNFSQLPTAKNRTVYDANLQSALPGTLVRSEGQGPSAINDVNQAYDFAGATYDYFFNTHGRDSYDGFGAELRSTVRYRENPGQPYQNAFWDGVRRQMVYGEGWAAADDVVAHELTHAVVENSADFFSYYQSGALSESYADIFGQAVDLTRGTVDDAGNLRWRVAEDSPVGAIRDMMTPTAFGDPGKMSDPQFFCVGDGATNPDSDRGGIHHNSGVPNHAFALMVDGGTYNGQTITGIGLTKAALVQYRALTTYLVSGSAFADNAMALNQSCGDLVGTAGITTGDCDQVAKAILAVEMASPWSCPGAAPPPALCPAGETPVSVFSDDMEKGTNWSIGSTSGTNWTLRAGFAKSGFRAAHGEDPAVISDHRLAMASFVPVPAGARMYFDHAFEFEHGGPFNFDGGVIEYSTDGTNWTDAGSLIDAGQAYGGVLDAGNILGARSAFVRNSFGYTGTRLNLASLASQIVRFRFRIGTDNSVGSFGWVVDNVRIYTCAPQELPTAANDAYWTALQTALNVPAPGVLANDTSDDSGPMTAVLNSGPSSGTLVFNANGSFTYTPNAGFSGTDTFTYRAVNDAGPSNLATVAITVTVQPIGVNDAYSTPFETPLNVAAPGVLVNDINSGGGAMTAIPDTGPSSGTLALSPDGGFTYTPNAGFSGVDSFTYRASNANGQSTPATVSITVLTPPAAADDTYSTPFQTTLNVASPGVLANDTSSGGPLTAILNTGPSRGTLLLNANGSFSYTPNPGFSGIDSFTYRASNDNGFSNAATVSIAVNVAPTTVNDAYSTPVKTPLNVAPPGVLTNDISNGGAGPMTAAVDTGPSSGTLVLNANGGFTYTPNTGFSGIDSFTYRAVDGAGPGNVGTVVIAVTVPPTTVNDAYSTPFQAPLTVAAPGVLANDINNGGGGLTAALNSGPSAGTLVLNPDGSFTYTPNAGFAGTDSFTYRASNAHGLGNVATVAITVANTATALPPTNLYVSSVVGNLVTVRWTPPAAGLPPTGYTLEGGISPGQVLASLPIPGTAPIFTFTAPTGAFFIRVHTLSGASVSGPSNEVPLVVNVPVAPSAPADLLGLVNGSSLTLAWKNTFGGGAPSSHLLEVSGAITTTLALGPGTSFSFAGVPPGTYTLRLRAVNAGGASAPSNAVTLTFPGPCSGAPLTPERFIAYTIGNRIFTAWEPAASGPAPTSFVLSVTGSFVGTLATASRSFSSVAAPGTYNLAVTAVNSCGSSAPTAVQTVTIP